MQSYLQSFLFGFVSLVAIHTFAVLVGKRMFNQRLLGIVFS